MEIINIRTDWEIKKLGEFAFHEKGKKPRRQQELPNEIFKHPYIDIEAFEKGILKTYTDGEKCNFCTEDDFLMVWDGSRSGLVGKGICGALGSTLVRINFPRIENNFAYYFLKSKYQQINTRAKGTGTPHVDPGLLWNYDFPIAPLPEQRAIVAKIEQLFSELDNGITNLKAAKAKLEIYRQAVLKKAFEGELTKEWREKQTNLPTADELLEVIKEEREKYYQKQLEEWEQAVKEWEENGKVEKKPGRPSKLKSIHLIDNENNELPTNWCKLNVENTSLKIVDCLHSTPKFQSNGKFCLDTTCIVDGQIIWNKIRYVNEESFQERIKRLKPKMGDIFFAREGTVGTTLILNKEIDVCLGQRMMMFRPIQTIQAKYFMYYFQSNEFKKQYKPLIGGTTSPHLNIGDVKKLRFPVCSLSEQEKIVQEIETRLSVCENIVRNIEEGLEKAEALRQSILKKAFEGKLLNEPELAACRRQPDWEPAEKLLARIHRNRRDAMHGVSTTTTTMATKTATTTTK